jgi:flagellar basal-body rod protein FlgB
VLDRLDSELNFYQKALNLRTYRQELLASNIANADTPNYKARDIDFKSALANTLAGRTEGALGLARTEGGHLPGEEASPYAGALKYRTEYQSSVDGNTVNMDIERASFAENSLHIEALLTFLRVDLKQLQTAVTSQ